MSRGSAAATCMCSMMMKGIQALGLVWLASLVMLQCHAFVVPTLPMSGKGFGAVATPNGASSPPCAGRARMEMKSCDRAGFIREGVLGGAAAIGVLGSSSPVSAAGFFTKDRMELEQVPTRTVVGKTQSISWADVAPKIAAMRAEAREHFAQTPGAEGGREFTTFSNQTPEGAEVTVGLEVSDAKGSPAVSNGFTASVISPPGQYLRDDHDGKPGMTPWISFMARLAKDGYTMEEPLAMFEVYSGQGGEESVTMYASVKGPAK
ncbi:unnamed protein product [Ectocarpus fasciculatus]